MYGGLLLCSVLRPANGRSAHHSLVKIICLSNKTSFSIIFCYFLYFPIYFFSFFRLRQKKMKKLDLKEKQMILTSKQSVEHPFAGRNTQHCGIHSQKNNKNASFKLEGLQNKLGSPLPLTN